MIPFRTLAEGIVADRSKPAATPEDAVHDGVADRLADVLEGPPPTPTRR
jgi:hypothetical protein